MERIQLATYHEIKHNILDDEVMTGLTPWEITMIKQLTRLETRGKQGPENTTSVNSRDEGIH
jgi:hypothetical protein